MAAKLLTAPERVGKTFGISIRVLGFAAVTFIVLALWSLLLRYQGQVRTQIIAPSSDALFFPSLEPALPEIGPYPSTTVQSSPFVPVETPLVSPSPAVISPIVTDPSVSLDPLNPTVLDPQSIPGLAAAPLPGAASEEVAEGHQGHVITNLEARTLADRALQMREGGDTAGALKALQQAEGLSPKHPKIMAEIATTFQQMGLDTKAATYWEEVHQMGPENAGAYFDLSDMALKGNLLDEATSVDTHLRITRHTAHKMETEDEGDQRVALRIHTEAIGEGGYDGEDLALYVYFFDLAEFHDGSRFEKTVAKTAQKLVSEPYDWKNKQEEIIEVEYFLKELSSEQRASLGKRQYYGYVVELYFRDTLQDVVASPRRLLRVGKLAPEALPYQGSGLFPR